MFTSCFFFGSFAQPKFHLRDTIWKNLSFFSQHICILFSSTAKHFSWKISLSDGAMFVQCLANGTPVLGLHMGCPLLSSNERRGVRKRSQEWTSALYSEVSPGAQSCWKVDLDNLTLRLSVNDWKQRPALRFNANPLGQMGWLTPFFSHQLIRWRRSGWEHFEKCYFLTKFHFFSGDTMVHL